MATPATQPTTTTNDEDPLRRPIPLIKRFTSTRGDSAAIVWILGILVVAGAAMVIAFSQEFSKKFVDAKGIEAFSTSYYTAYAAHVFAIITIVTVATYCGWVFIDGRHPMRDAAYAKHDPKGWQKKQEGKKNSQYSDTLIAPKAPTTPPSANQPTNATPAPEKQRHFIQSQGYPGIATFSVDRLNRLKSNRLFLKRSHLQKLIIAEAGFFLGWAILFTVFSSKDSYLRSTRIGEGEGTRIVGICPEEQHRDACQALAKTAITSAVLAGLLLLSLVACLIARPSLNPQKYTTA